MSKREGFIEWLGKEDTHNGSFFSIMLLIVVNGVCFSGWVWLIVSLIIWMLLGAQLYEVFAKESRMNDWFVDKWTKLLS